ncbi:MAG TPA: PilT/PilU family type 4a pilus ATPase [Planctomycetota bacterium]|nr:PilT/PilU family type 4a pilus ATPase [Planctomycetota bacterium]
MEPNLFGQILLNLSLISPKQLEQVLSLQRQGEEKPLGELLVEQRILDERTVNTILSIQTRRMKVWKGKDDPTDDSFRQRMQVADMASFVKFARESKASHIYLGAREIPTLRLHGSLRDLPLAPLSPERAEELLFQMMTAEQVEQFRSQKSIHFCLETPEMGRVRLSVFKHRAGVSGVVRPISVEIPLVESLGLPPAIKSLAMKNNGLVIITGPGLSGKTTTLAAMVDIINRNQRRHIITIEDPIETIHRSQLSLVSHRQVGEHTQSFASALRAALREDPDVLVIGEMKDAETIATAITAAETGHLVLGTLHTRSSYRTIIRIVDQFPPPKRSNVRTILSGVLRGIVCQNLVPNLDGNGQSLASEVLLVNAAISNLIREDRIWQIPMVMQMGTQEGMCLMDDALLLLVKQGRISLEEALARASEREKFLRVQELSASVKPAVGWKSVRPPRHVQESAASSRRERQYPHEV